MLSVKEQKVHPRGMTREDAKVDASIDRRGSQRRALASRYFKVHVLEIQLEHVVETPDDQGVKPNL